MANLSDIFGWFSIGKTPTAQQFRDTFSSYFHKSEKLPQTAVYGLNDALTDLNDNKVDRDELISLGVGIKGYGDDVQDIADLDNVPDKYEGMGVLVLNDKDENGNSYIWLYDGAEWKRTPFTSFPKDIVTKVNLSETNEITDLNSRIVYRGNLHNINTDLIGKSLSNNGLVLTDTENYILTDYILVDVGVAHRCTESMRKYWCFADKNSPALDFQESVVADVHVVPVGKYVRFIYSILLEGNTVLFGRANDNLTGDAIPYSKYDDEILTTASDKVQSLDEKVTYKPSANRHNPDTDLKGNSLSNNGLILTETAAYTLTDYIEVQSNVAHRCTQMMRKFWSFADKKSPALDYISTSIGAGIKVTPIGKYVRFIYLIDVAGDDVRFGRSDDDVNIPYGETPYTKTDDEFLTPKSEQIVKLDEDVQVIDKKVIYKTNANLHNPETDSLNTSLQANGSTIASEVYNTSAYQKVEGGKEYRFIGLSGGTNTSGAYMRRIVEFDANYNVIKSTDSVQTITLDANTVYVRYMYHNVANPAQVYFGLASADINVPYGERAYDRNGNKLLLNSDIATANGDTVLTLDNSDKWLHTGSSSIESFYSPDRKAWVNKLQEFIDYIIVPYGFSGQSANSIAAKLIANLPTQTANGVHPSQIKPTYAFAGQTLNENDSIAEEFDTSFIQGNENLLRAAVSRTGAFPILGTAYRTEFRPWIENSLKKLADKWGAWFFPFGTYHRSMIRTSKYAGFYGNGHPAIRTHEAYTLPLLSYFERMPRPKQTILIFESRNQNASISELTYTDNYGRAVLFRSIQVGEMSLDDAHQNMYDRLDESGYTIKKVNTSEYMKLLKKEPVQLGNIVLIEAIIPKVSPDNVKFEYDADNVTTIYAFNNYTKVYDVLESNDIQSSSYIEYDRIKLLFIGVGIVLRDIKFTISGGRDKPIQQLNRIEPITAGTPIIESVGFDASTIGDWNVTTNERHNITTKYGAQFNDVPAYLGESKDVIVLTDSLSRVFSIDTESFGYKTLRIWTCARLNPKIYNPDAYAAWTGENNPYTDVSWYHPDKYDYDDMNIIVKYLGVSYNNQCKSVNIQKVGLFWHLGYVDVILPITRKGNYQLVIDRHTHHNDYDMEICDVSVELLGN